MFEQGRSQRDAWMSWPVSIAPVLAAELGVEPDAVLRTLTHLVREHLAELGNSI
jgi:predicted ArsR family transcriptional regulator